MDAGGMVSLMCDHGKWNDNYLSVHVSYIEESKGEARMVIVPLAMRMTDSPKSHHEVDLIETEVVITTDYPSTSIYLFEQKSGVDESQRGMLHHRLSSANGKGGNSIQVS